MSKLLGYNFDKVQLKRGCYIPKGHGDIEMEQTIVRRGFAQLFLGTRALPIEVVQAEAPKDETE